VGILIEHDDLIFKVFCFVSAFLFIAYYHGCLEKALYNEQKPAAHLLVPVTFNFHCRPW